MDAEAEPPEVVLLSARVAPNYMHPLVADVLNMPDRGSAGINGDLNSKSGSSTRNISLMAAE